MKLREEKGKISIIFNIILVIIAIVAIYYVWHIYRINDFGQYEKAEYTMGLSNFTRDDKIKYSNKYSYKIESKEFNDALIYRNIDVEENTLYRVTAMVKYENVENEKDESEGGVNIGIMDTTEKSDSLTGSGEWETLSFEFDSRNRNNVDIVFRLGSYDDNSKGTVWFSDFKLDKGKKDTNNNWNFICLIMKNLEVDIEKNGIKTKTNLNLQPSEISLIESNMKRFQNSMKEMSKGLMTVTYKTILVEKPITSISYNDDYGNYIATSNIEEILKRYVDDGGIEYDHIFVAYKLGEDLHEERIRTGDWIGLRRNDI